jgi:hypothetical protein
MKKSVLTWILAAGFLAFVSVRTVAAAGAADERSDKKKSALDADQKKYDKNGNGKLDPDEEAAMKADQAKARAEEERNRQSGQKKGK